MMAEEQNDAQPQSFALDWLVSNLRWLWILMVAIFVVAQAMLATTPSPYFMRLLGLVGVAIALNGIYAIMLWLKYFPSWLAVTSVIIDTVFALALLIMLNDYAQVLLPLVLFPVIVAGVRWNTDMGLLVAIPLILGYAAPLIPIVRGVIDRQALEAALITITVNALTFLLAATLPGPFLRQHVKEAREADQAEMERLRVENKRGKLISEMAVTLSSTLNYQKVLRATMDSAFAAMVEVGTGDESTIGMVLLFEGDDGKLSVVEGRNISRNDEGRKVSSQEGLIGRTISTAEPVITHRAQSDKVITSFASTPGVRSAICAPLRAGLSTYGAVLFCSTESRAYNQDHKALLATFCSQAIIALQNAQLFEDVHHEQQKILEQEAEARRKLARDLHDGPTQSIAAIVMRLNFIKNVLQNNDYPKALDEVIKVEEIAQRTTQEIRTMLFAMRPVIMETQGLVPALHQYADRLTESEPFKVSIINHGYEGQLKKEAEGVVFQIVEEAIGNAKKHSQASEIRVTLAAKNGHLLVEIRDNGVGFDVEATQATYDQRTSLGLINMDERAELVGGRCSIESARGKGTAVRAEIPFHRAEDIV